MIGVVRLVSNNKTLVEAHQGLLLLREYSSEHKVEGLQRAGQGANVAPILEPAPTPLVNFCVSGLPGS